MPTATELDTLLGFKPDHTAIAGLTTHDREVLLGNAMHVKAVERLLQDQAALAREPALQGAADVAAFTAFTEGASPSGPVSGTRAAAPGPTLE